MNVRNLVVMAASTGGPPVLTTLFSRMPVINAAVIIVQHMTRTFSSGFTERLNGQSRMAVILAADRMPLEPGRAYFAPGGYHLEVVNNESIRILEGEKVNYVCPAADVTMMSLKAPRNGGLLVGVVLTGIGKDGAAGIQHIKRLGGVTIVQSPETAAVYGMPQAAIATGATDFVLAPEGIADRIVKLVGEMKEN